MGKLSAALKMSDSKLKSAREKTGKRSGDLRLSVIRRGFPDYTHRQIQRWAEAGTIPGAYHLKRGHWRIRDCPAFRRWWNANTGIPLSWAIKGYDTKRIMSKLLPGIYDAFRPFRENGPLLDRLAKLVGMETRDGPDGAWASAPHPYWHTPLNQLPRQLWQWAEKATGAELTIFSAVGDLMARGVKLSVKNVARYLSMSPATFYRRGYGPGLRKALRVFGEDAPVVSKHSKARKLYQDQVLQETKHDDVD